MSKAKGGLPEKAKAHRVGHPFLSPNNKYSQFISQVIKPEY